MQLIYDELSAGRPVIYSGINRSNPDKTYGHTFVVHGCDADGLVCVNWGWRGQHDGFFDIDLLSANGSSFNDDQDMILVKPGTHDQCAVKVIATGAGKVHLGDVTNAVADTTKIYKVDEGASVTLTAIPDDGWRISHVFVGHDEVMAQVKDGQYTLESVDDNVTVSVTFEKAPIQYRSLRITARGDGSVAYDSTEFRNAAKAFRVADGTAVRLVITPDEGWNIRSVTINGNEVLYESVSESQTIEMTIVADDVVAVVFARNVYQLTYWVDGVLYRQYEVEYGASIVPERAPAKEGYTFSGWSTVPPDMPAGNVDVSGAFTVNTYKVTYMVDGAVILTDSLAYQSPIPLPTVPERSGYDFEWDDPPETMPAHDVTIVGSYTVVSAVASAGVGASFRLLCGTLYLSGLQPGEHVTICSLSGECLLTARATAQGSLTIPLSNLPAALYIVRTSRQTFKMAR